MKISYLGLGVLAVWLGFCPGAFALDSPLRAADHVQARLLSAVDTTGALAELDGGLEINPEAGWHFYWRTPGDAGQAPTIDWKSSANVSGVTMEWPAPQRFTDGQAFTFGYGGSTILPLAVKITTPGQPVVLTITASIFVCKDICIPQTVPLTLSIPAGAAQPGASAQLVTQALAHLSLTADTPTLKIESTVVGPDALVIQAYATHGFANADLFVESPSLRLFQPPQITPDTHDSRRASIRIPKANASDNLAKQVMGKTLTLTLVTGDGALEKSIPF